MVLYSVLLLFFFFFNVRFYFWPNLNNENTKHLPENLMMLLVFFLQISLSDYTIKEMTFVFAKNSFMIP